MTANSGKRKEFSLYEKASKEMRLLVLRNSLLAVYRHAFLRTISKEFNQRERHYSIYSTREETIARMREKWLRARKEEKEVIMFPAREKTGK